MASATNISATEAHGPAALDREAVRKAFPKRTKLKASRVGRARFGGALLIGNMLGLMLLMFGGLGLSAYRDGLIEARTDLVERQAVLARAALSADALAACGDVNCLIRRAEAQRVLEAASAGFAGELYVFRQDASRAVLVAQDPEPESFAHEVVPVPSSLPAAALPQTVGQTLSGWIEHIVFEWPISSKISRRTIEEEAAAVLSGAGGEVRRLRYGEDGSLVASVSLPITSGAVIEGALIAQSRDIEVVSTKIKRALLPIIFLTFGFASFSAAVLTAAVSQPLRQLAAAAERVRTSVGRAGQVKIPDFDHRGDDVGRLSRSFRTMVNALVDRIQSIDSFAADVSHELKNPLTSIRSAVETFSKAKTDHQREQLLDIISNDVERMDRLISDISSASRLDMQLATESRRVVKASGLVGEVARSYRAVTEAGGPVVNFWDETDSRSEIFAGPAALGRVFRNLIDNAVSFSPKGGAVTVALEKAGGARHGHVVVTVSDEGPGIPDDALESIFDRFYTSRPKGATFGSNSGLGLAIARQIVESHGGRIWAENVEPEKDQDGFDDEPAGARFFVELPVHGWTQH